MFLAEAVVGLRTWFEGAGCEDAPAATCDSLNPEGTA